MRPRETTTERVTPSTEDLKALLPEKECANPTRRGTMGSIRREEALTAPADTSANPADTDVILSSDTSKEKTMALSEREQKVLDQLEELMSNEDPHFASSMSSTGNTAPVFSARHLALGILFVLIGLGIIIGAVASNMIWLGVFGFLFAAGGVYFATTSKKTPVDSFLGGKAEGAARVRQREQKERSSFMNRLENRWDERNNGQL